MAFQNTLNQRARNAATLRPYLRDDDDEHKSKYRPMSTGHFLAVLCLMVLVFAAVIVIEKQLPVGLKVSDSVKNTDRFIAERAHQLLDKLTRIGPRVTGSYQNEVLAVNLLKDEINKIIREKNERHVIELDVQKVSGAFNLEFLDGMTNVYQDVQNVVVKVGSDINSPHSLLINCHFDTVVDSLGKYLVGSSITTNLVNMHN